jgi:hypothetical protein
LGKTGISRWHWVHFSNVKFVGVWKMPISMTFSPPILFFASSSPRHHFFSPRHFPLVIFPSSFTLLPTSSFSSSSERLNERTNERLPSPHLSTLLIF